MRPGMCILLVLAGLRGYHWWVYRNAKTPDDLIHLALARADACATLSLAIFLGAACA